MVVESFENLRKVSFSQRTLRKFNEFGFLNCFDYVTNFLVQSECMLLKFFSFTFMKIEQNYLLFLVHARTYEETARDYISQNHTPKDEKDGNGEIKIMPP